MAYNVSSLVTALSESRRFTSFASDSFRLLPSRQLIISQHGDTLFALPRPRSDKTEDLLLSEDFVQGEGREVAQDYFQRLAVEDRSAVCLLDANEENLYNETARSSKCVYSAGGLAAYAVNHAEDTLAVALCSGILALYDIVHEGSAVSLKINREFKTNTRNVTQICFDSSDAYVACGSVDGAVVVFHEGAPFAAFHHQQGHISVLRFYPKGLRLLAGTQNGDIVMYCLKHKAPIATFQDHLSEVNDIAFLIAEDDAQSGFVSCARDSYVCFWSLDVKKKDVKGAVASHNVLVKKPFKRLMQFESVIGISIVNQGLKNKGTAPWALFVATESGVLRLIDPITEKALLKRTAVYGQGDELRSATLCKASNDIVVLGSAGTLAFYSVNLELQHQLLCNVDGAFQFHLFQGPLAVDARALRRPQAEGTTRSDAPAVGNEGSVPDSTKKPSKKKASKSADKNADTRGSSAKDAMDVDSPAESGDTKNEVHSALGKVGAETRAGARDLQFSQQDWLHSLEWLNSQVAKCVPVVFILCGDDAIRLLALDGWGSCVTLGLANEKHRHMDTVLSIAYSQSGNILASGGKDERVLIWDLRTLTAVITIPLDGLNVACIALPSGISTDTTTFRLIATGNNVMKSFDVPTSWALSAPDASTVLSACSKQPLSIANAAATAVKHKKPINAVAFSHNRKVIASAGSDKIVVIYAAENLIVKGECVGHRRSVLSVAFTTVNKTVVSASIDLTIKIWNLNDFSCIKTLQGHTKAVMRVVVLPNDLQLLSVGMDGLVKVWNIKTSDCIFTADNHSDKVRYNRRLCGISVQVWNVEVAGSNLMTISGNGVLIWWRDVSAEVEAKKLMDEREEELKRTQVECLAADGKYSEALCLAMELRKPLMASKILQRRASNQLFRVEKEMPQDDLFRSWVAHLKKVEDRKKMLTIAFDFVQLWVSKGSTSWMANCLLGELIAQFTPTELFVVEGMAQRIESILSHQSSHLTRFLNLSEKSHLLDILLGYNKELSAGLNAVKISHNILYK
ncbi:WD domain, G-beta repeat containing protein, putative [Babesia bigemina]|uniref:WD domain, G-beta repeat containing protein, putative n=1 Tax=Babesia bigemina TaxID=5866 RepID=A0A061CZG1_BABBI|nr:WD domain, G-beta repeat containing protein, putative [Babesia bigemina]CDR94016.1 WD domain, G-beta repeat containing protein, putative [Babesia bigemina]|eukprot:XP_012766202.1 WD domain, G-beta repeat containing protein, putative [Babesia bigemina]